MYITIIWCVTWIDAYHIRVINRKIFFGKAPEKTLKPSLFSHNPDAKDAFKRFGVQQLKEELSAECMHEYVLEQLVPQMIVN